MNHSAGGGPLLAYLIGHYPGFSVTFIQREIALLRSMGLQIETAAINPPVPPRDGFTPAEQEEQRRTFYVKTRPLARIAADHIRTLLRAPAAYLRGLLFAIRLGRADLRELVYHLLYFAEAVVVGQWMRRASLSHVHVQFAVNTATVALIAAKMFPIRYSISVHGTSEFDGSERYRLREKIEGAEFLCCMSQFSRSQLMKVSDPGHWPKLHLTRLGVDPDVFAPRHQPSKGPINIVCVARLSREKGHGILIGAIASLIREGFSVHLHLAGDGPLRTAIEAEVRRVAIDHAVSFLGSLNQDQLKPLWALADICVLPSFMEGIPVVLMEAMSMEIPCVSTYVGGIPELIESGKNGLLVSPSDPGLLSQALRTLIRDTELRARMGAAGRQKVLEAFNLGPNVEVLAEVFRNRLGHAGSPVRCEALVT